MAICGNYVCIFLTGISKLKKLISSSEEVLKGLKIKIPITGFRV